MYGHFDMSFPMSVWTPPPHPPWAMGFTKEYNLDYTERIQLSRMTSASTNGTFGSVAAVIVFFFYIFILDGTRCPYLGAD